MGIAASLSRIEREQIARSVLEGVEPQLYNGKIAAHCPFHKEDSPGGAFFYDAENDVGRCYSCGHWGDLLSICNQRKGLQPDDSEGYREFVEEHMKGAATTAKTRKAAKTMGPPPAWQPRAYDLPPERWSQKCGEFVDTCCAALLRNDARLEDLFAWGILPETVAAMKIGWHEGENGGSGYRKFSHWGLPAALNENGNERCVRLPRGFVFPGYRGSGDTRRVISVHVRPDAKEFEKDPKYIRLTGSGNHYYVFGSPRWTAWVIVETVRDAMLLAQELGPLQVGAMAVAGATIAPDTTAHKILSGADIIVNAMDNDQAGRKASWHFEPWNTGKFSWQTQYPNAVRWLVPSAIGKDVGDLPAAGVAVWDWFSAGLPDHILRRLEIRRDALARDGGAVGEAEAGAEAENGGAADQAQGVNQGGEAGNQTTAPVNESGDGVAQKAQAAPAKTWKAPQSRPGVRYLPMPAPERVDNDAYAYLCAELAASGTALLLEVNRGKLGTKAVWPVGAPEVKKLHASLEIMLRMDTDVKARIEKALKEAA